MRSSGIDMIICNSSRRGEVPKESLQWEGESIGRRESIKRISKRETHISMRDPVCIQMTVEGGGGGGTELYSNVSFQWMNREKEWTGRNTNLVSDRTLVFALQVRNEGDRFCKRKNGVEKGERPFSALLIKRDNGREWRKEQLGNGLKPLSTHVWNGLEGRGEVRLSCIREWREEEIVNQWRPEDTLNGMSSSGMSWEGKAGYSLLKG